ncbi:phosphatidate phosphatase LPIN2 isoform X2 [Myripristis murdjan]|uniref:phosphatidate phosphatase LPIN2 isoform X2 n=1 Tax=Myripristis murdjan TaxID=586833 RepID=UPI001175DACC|nr:phosphatidate phosphatase LPIN2-like isoform X2 [Myripristis murdjan]
MNIVGQLAETVFVTVKELYRGLNPATLTGGIDVIVVRQPDGSFQCSPFHVRFGKLGVLRSKEKVVDIEINGEPVHLHMKLGDNGEAFFVEENENMESRVPAHLCTSPIPIEVPEEAEETMEGSSSAGGGTRRKKRRRKRMRSDTHLREEASSSSDDRERERECERDRDQAEQESPANEDPHMIMQVSKSVYYSLSEEPYEELMATQTRDTHPHSDGEWSPSENVFYSRPSSPKSDSELIVKPQESSGPQMQWNWGGFPMLYQSERSQCIPPSDSSHFRTIERQDSFDMGFEPTITCGRVGSVTVVRPQPRSRSLDLDSLSIQTTPGLLEESLHIAHFIPNATFESVGSSAVIDINSTQTCAHVSLVDTLHTAEELAEEVPSMPLLEEHRKSSSPSASLINGGHVNCVAKKECTVSVAPISDMTDIVSPVSTSNTISMAKPDNVQNQPKKEKKACTVKADVLDNHNTAVLATASSITAASSNSTETLNSKDDTEQHGALYEPSEQGPTDGAPVSEGDSGIEPCTVGAEGGGPELRDRSTEGPLTSQTAEIIGGKDTEASSAVVKELAISSEAHSKPEQPDKKRGKHSQHLGPSDIYLDDLTKLDPEVAALYFPKSEAEGASRHGAEQGSSSGNQSPQSVGSGAMDSGTEYLSDSAAYHMDVSMSLCGCEGDTRKIKKEKFMKHIVMYQDFINNPGIIEDPNLVICINSNYYNWAVAAPMILSMQAFQKNLPKSAIERLVKDKMPKKSGRWWFSWRRRDMDTSQPKSSTQDQEEESVPVPSTIQASLDDIDSDEEAGLGRPAVIPTSLSTDTISTTQCISQMYRKSLRLTSKQIERLNLREGANKVVFSVTTQYQGTCRCEAAIYLWNWDDRVIISDIDGTITKSDALGHILPQFGKDWTHQGIARLYHKIHQNGYKFLYCSARAIGMAGITKDYLQWVNDKGTVLPKGPVMLAPSSLFSALHREVIEKKPEVFKVACLTDIRDLFNPQRQPFYAAFGNRTNDAYAYKQVGVPDSRIFTVNPKGELIQEKTKGNKSSYNHLGEIVEHMFPMLSVKSCTSSAFDCPEYSHFLYWREPLPELDLDALP